MPADRLATVILITVMWSGCDDTGLVLSDRDSDSDAPIDLPGDPDAVVDVPPDAGYPDGMKTLPPFAYTWTGCRDPLPPGSPTDPMVDAVFVLEDMEGDFPVEGVQLEVFYSNSVSGTPDLDATDLDLTDMDGRITAPVPAGRWIAVRVIGGTTPLYPPGEIMTSVAFDVETPATDGGLIPVACVSQITYILISVVLGIVPDPSLGNLFGALTDCAGVPIAGAVARLYEPSGSRCSTSATCLDRYFIDETPAMDQWWTSDDGRYALINVPPLDGYGLELHGIVPGSSCPGDLVVVGERGSVHVMADTISIVDLTCTDLDDSPWSSRCVF